MEPGVDVSADNGSLTGDTDLQSLDILTIAIATGEVISFFQQKSIPEFFGCICIDF